jgi:hypothetical protein
MSDTEDLTTLKPWLAERDGRSWRVTAPGRYGAVRQLVASHLSEEDAKRIALASDAEVLLERLFEAADFIADMAGLLAGGVSPESVRVLLEARADTLKGIAEDHKEAA